MLKCYVHVPLYLISHEVDEPSNCSHVYFQCSETVALSKFGEFLMEFVSMFQSIKEAPIPKYIPVSKTDSCELNLFATQVVQFIRVFK